MCIRNADTQFGLVSNISDTTGISAAVDLAALQINFFDSTVGLLFSAPYKCASCSSSLPPPLQEANQGSGKSGFLLRVALSASEAALFGGNPVNRLGMAATVRNTDNSPKVFYLMDLPSSDDSIDLAASLDPGTVNAEPASLVLLASGLLGIGLLIRQRRSQLSRGPGRRPGKDTSP
jgi:hypothetical protein